MKLLLAAALVAGSFLLASGAPAQSIPVTKPVTIPVVFQTSDSYVCPNVDASSQSTWLAHLVVTEGGHPIKVESVTCAPDEPVYYAVLLEQDSYLPTAVPYDWAMGIGWWQFNYQDILFEEATVLYYLADYKEDGDQIGVSVYGNRLENALDFGTPPEDIQHYAEQIINDGGPLHLDDIETTEYGSLSELVANLVKTRKAGTRICVILVGTGADSGTGKTAAPALFTQLRQAGIPVNFVRIGFPETNRIEAAQQEGVQPYNQPFNTQAVQEYEMYATRGNVLASISGGTALMLREDEDARDFGEALIQRGHALSFMTVDAFPCRGKACTLKIKLGKVQELSGKVKKAEAVTIDRLPEEDKQ